jgi:hypothetical protein
MSKPDREALLDRTHPTSTAVKREPASPNGLRSTTPGARIRRWTTARRWPCGAPASWERHHPA